MTDLAGLVSSLDANRSGQLSEIQLSDLDALIKWRTKGLIGRALHSHDSLVKDVHDGQVESIDGAITKKTIRYTDNAEGGSAPPSYRIFVANRQVGNQEFRPPTDIFESAPDAGMVRLYYLPRSRHVVNLELLPDPPVEDPSFDGVKRVLATGFKAWRAHDQVGGAEARAEMAAMEHKVESYVADSPPAADQRLGAEALTDALAGSWTNPFLSVSFRPDGTLTGRMANGVEQQGRWSVDSDGRLHADVMGASQVAEATVAGDELLLGIDGRWVKLHRVSGD
jgi:hypothetical protein